MPIIDRNPVRTHSQFFKGPVRLGASKSCRAYISEFVAIKRSETIRCESRNERNCLTLLDVLESVVEYCPQPTRIEFEDDGKKRFTIPDFAVRTLDGSVKLWEVKMANAFCNRKVGLISEACDKLNVGYVAVSHRELQRKPILANAQSLHRYSHVPVTEFVARAVSSCIVQPGVRSLADLCRVTGLSAAELMPAALRGHFAIDLTASSFPYGASVRRCREGAISGGFISSSSTAAAGESTEPTDRQISNCIRNEPPLPTEREQARQCRKSTGYAPFDPQHRPQQ